MKNIKNIALILSVLTMSLLVGYIALAWQSPTAPPPQENVPAPLNVGSDSQRKIGSLRLGGLRTDSVTYLATESGNVGIGREDPGYKLDVLGDIRWSGTLMGGTVPWARLGSFPPACDSGQFVTAVGSTLTCETPPTGNGTGGMTQWRIAADGTSGSATVGQDQTVTIVGGTGITATRSTRDVTASLTYPTKSCSSGQAIRSFDLGSSAGPTCIDVGGASLPSGSSGQTLRHDGTNWVANSNIFNNGTNVGIGTASPAQKLAVQGNTYISGTLGVGTTAPRQQLHLTGSAHIDGDAIFLRGHKIEVGFERGAHGEAYIDFASEAGADYNLRLIRYSGANGGSDLIHRGGGILRIRSFDAAPIVFATGGGNVGIDTASPAAKLDVRGPESTEHGANAAIRIQNSASGGAHWLLRAGATGTVTPAGGFSIANSGGYRLVITSGGNVGIGTTDPGTHKLNVNGGVYASSYSCDSDLRFKQDLQELNNVLDKIKNINAYSFKWNNSELPEKEFPQGEQLGLIAQEVEKEFPQLVNTGEDGYKSMDYQKMVPVLLQAVKEQQERIEALEKAVIGE